MTGSAYFKKIAAFPGRSMPEFPYPTPHGDREEDLYGNEIVAAFEGVAAEDVVKQDFIECRGCFGSFSPDAFLYYLRPFMTIWDSDHTGLELEVFYIVYALSKMRLNNGPDINAWTLYDLSILEIDEIHEWVSRLTLTIQLERYEGDENFIPDALAALELRREVLAAS